MYEFSLIELLGLAVMSVIIGVILRSFFTGSGGESKEKDEKIQQLESEVAALEAQKSEVSGHFQKTASLLHDMTGQYKAIYEHMAEGAQTLCDENDSGAVLESLQSGLLSKERLTEIGQTSTEEEIEVENESDEKS